MTSKYIIPGVKVEAGDTILESSAFRRSLKPKAGLGFHRKSLWVEMRRGLNTSSWGVLTFRSQEDEEVPATKQKWSSVTWKENPEKVVF